MPRRIGSALLPKQQRFVEEYLKDLNATQAALRAGYSARTAKAQGSRLLTNADVATAVAIAKSERQERVEITADSVVREIDLVARSNIADVLVVDEETCAISVRDLRTLPAHVQRAIKSIRQVVTERPAPDGGAPLKTVRLEIEMHPKTTGLRMLMDHLGMDAPRKTEATVHGSLELQRCQERSTAELVALALELARPPGT